MQQAWQTLVAGALWGAGSWAALLDQPLARSSRGVANAAGETASSSAAVRVRLLDQLTLLLLMLMLQELPEDYNCPICGATKDKFESRVKVCGIACVL